MCKSNVEPNYKLNHCVYVVKQVCFGYNCVLISQTDMGRDCEITDWTSESASCVNCHSADQMQLVCITARQPG